MNDIVGHDGEGAGPVSEHKVSEHKVSEHKVAEHKVSEHKVAEFKVAEYKRVLQAVCDNRPSGTRGRLAAALGTNRSFISQLVNPAYSIPIPPQHLEKIFEVCHFSAAERQAFLVVYDRAHPGRRAGAAAPPKLREVTMLVPDLGHAQKNRVIEEMLAAYCEQLAKLTMVLAE